MQLPLGAELLAQSLVQLQLGLGLTSGEGFALDVELQLLRGQRARARFVHALARAATFRQCGYLEQRRC